MVNEVRLEGECEIVILLKLMRKLIKILILKNLVLIQIRHEDDSENDFEVENESENESEEGNEDDNDNEVNKKENLA